MNEIVDVLMRRDGMTEEQATNLFNDTQAEILDCGGDYDTAEQIMADNLGLEMDYIIDII